MIDFSKSELDKEDKPPFLGTWYKMYGAVFLVLVVTIFLLYWFKISY